MKPSKIKHDQKLLVKPSSGSESRIAYFIKRIPAQGGEKAINLVKFPDFKGVISPDDDGICHMSDYDLSRLGEYA